MRQVDWLEPWDPIDDDSVRSALEQELLRELGRRHPLYGIPVRAVGQRDDCDDVLFALEDGTARVAVVHLTWPRSVPDRPPWPGTRFYDSLEAWRKSGMLEDHEDCPTE